MKMLNNKLFRVVAPALMLGAAACATDDIIEIRDFDYDAQVIYLKQPAKTGYNMEYRAIPDGYDYTSDGIGEYVDVAEIFCTKPATKDIEVGLAIDTEYIDSYNAEEMAAAEAEEREPVLLTLPENLEFESPTVVIKKGEYISSTPIRIHCLNQDDFQTGGEPVKNVVFPVKIASTTEGKVTIDETRNSTAISFASKFVSNAAAWSSTATTTYPLQLFESGEPRNGLESVDLSQYIKLTYPAAENTTVKLKINYDLIANSSYPNAKPLTKASLSKTTLTIAEGEDRTNEEDVLSLLFPDGMAEMVSGTNYLIPIEIESVSGFGLETPTTQNVIYYYITTSTFIPNWVTFTESERSWTLNFSNEDGTRLNTASQIDFGATVRTQRAISQTAYVYLKIDNSLIEKYNKEHNTSYEAVSDDEDLMVTSYMYISTNASQPSSSYTVKITFYGGMESIQKGHKYLIPVTIDRIQCNDTNVAAGEDGNSVFYAIIETAEVDPPAIQSSPSIPAGTQVPIDNIKANIYTLTTGALGVDWTNNVTGRGSSMAAWNFNSNGMQIDLGSEYNLTGLQFNVYSATYGVRMFKMFVSDDNSQWTEVGESNVLTQAAAQNAVLRKPVNARYIRLQVIAGYYSYGYVYLNGTKGILFYHQ